MRTLVAQAVSHAHRWGTLALTESYLRVPRAAKKYLEQRNPHAPHEDVSTVLWLSGVQGWCLDWLDDELSVAVGLLFVACGVVGTLVGRRLFS